MLWAGNNENEAAVAQNWYHITDDKLNQTKAEYRKLYVDTVMNAVRQVDPGTNRPFVTSSPSNGVQSVVEDYIASDPQDPRYGTITRIRFVDKDFRVPSLGDVHFYGYSVDSWNISTYPITRFLSETGIQSLPSLDAWKQVTSNSSDWNVNSSLMIHREHKENQTFEMLLVHPIDLIDRDSLLYF